MVLPHFDAVGKADDVEVILGPEVVENREQGILGLNKHRSETSHTSDCLVLASPGLETAHQGESRG